MKAGTPNDFRDMPLDDNDPVWQLLGRAPLPEPDAWFAARTMARCRHEGRGRQAGSFRRIWRWVLGTGLGVSLAMVVVASQIHSEQVDRQKKVQEAFEIMASMDSDADSSTSASSPSWAPDSSL